MCILQICIQRHRLRLVHHQASATQPWSIRTGAASLAVRIDHNLGAGLPDPLGCWCKLTTAWSSSLALMPCLRR